MIFTSYTGIKEIAADDARKQYPASSKAFFFAKKLKEEQLKEEALKMLLREYNEKKLDNDIFEAVSRIGVKEGEIIVYTMPASVDNTVKYIVLKYGQAWYYRDYKEDEGFVGITGPLFEEKIRIYEAL